MWRQYNFQVRNKEVCSLKKKKKKERKGALKDTMENVGKDIKRSEVVWKV